MMILLLNASYEPLSVISKQRAVALWLRGRVDAATHEMISLQGTDWVLDVPAILRLKRYIYRPHRDIRWSRAGVLRRDGYRCIYCGIQAGDQQKGRIWHRADFTLDHILPLSRGGQNSWQNTACACAGCNHRKGNHTPQEAKLTLLWTPDIPRLDYLVAPEKVPATWQLYLQ